MLREIPYTEVTLNPFTAFDDDWMALSAGTKENGYNSMTVSWGQLGTVWGEKGRQFPVAVCYVRPQRYTKQFMDREPLFTLSWFGDTQRKALGILGTKSGRDCDKIAESGLTPVFADGTVGFEEAKLVFVCRKLFRSPVLESQFIDPAVVAYEYPEKDFHDLYIGEIVKVYKGE